MSEEVKQEAKQETGIVAKQDRVGMGKFGVELQSLDDLWRFAKMVASSDFAPKGVNRPEQIAIAVQAGLEIGLKPMQALQSIAVINGRPAVWGDAVLGLCQGTGQMERYKQEEVGEKGKDTYGYKVTVKRRNFDVVESVFTVEDAKKAALWGKSGPWAQYPARMLLNRARAFALRDTFADVLKGCPLAEEAQDLPTKEVAVTIHEPDGTETKVKAKGMKAVKERIAKTVDVEAVPAPEKPQDSTGLSDAEKAEIEANDNGELPLK